VNPESRESTYWQVFLCFLTLGCTSFGGPVAHIGFFRQAFVAKRKWLSDDRFSDYLALCQFIPGPASSQLGMAIGYHQRGYFGAFFAWLGFTLPSAVLLAAFALLVSSDALSINAGAIHGLKLVALAVVVHAFWSMAKSLAPDAPRASILVGSAVLMWLLPMTYTAPLLMLVVGTVCSILGPRGDKQQAVERRIKPVRVGFIPACLLLMFVLGLVVLPWFSQQQNSEIISQFAAYFQSGALVFGGGHVVLPLLETEVLSNGWVDRDSFLAGYGAAQAVPGPLFTFASYLGAAHTSGLMNVSGAVLATAAIFLPSFLLLFGILPIWENIRLYPRLRSALWGINASVVGLLLAALYDPIWVSSVSNATDLSFALCIYLALAFWRITPPILVVLGGFLGMLLL
jgi:chromate transporter